MISETPSTLSKRMTSLVGITNDSIVSSFREKVSLFFEQNGLTMRHLTARHGQLLHSDDDATALRAVDLGYKLHGFGADDLNAQGDINIQVNIVQASTNPPIPPGGMTGTPANRG